MRPIDWPVIPGSAARCRPVLSLPDCLNPADSGIALANQSVNAMPILGSIFKHLLLDARQLDPEFMQRFRDRVEAIILRAQKPGSRSHDRGPNRRPYRLEKFYFERGHTLPNGLGVVVRTNGLCVSILANFDDARAAASSADPVCEHVPVMADAVAVNAPDVAWDTGADALLATPAIAAASVVSVPVVVLMRERAATPATVADPDDSTPDAGCSRVRAAMPETVAASDAADPDVACVTAPDALLAAPDTTLEPHARAPDVACETAAPALAAVPATTASAAAMAPDDANSCVRADVPAIVAELSASAPLVANACVLAAAPAIDAESSASAPLAANTCVLFAVPAIVDESSDRAPVAACTSVLAAVPATIAEPAASAPDDAKTCVLADAPETVAALAAGVPVAS